MKLKELEDFDWFPDFLRKWQMYFIRTVVNAFDIYRPLYSFALPTNDVIDLCSGDGEVAKYVNRYWKKDLVVTDKSPSGPHVEPLDVLNYSIQPATTYTMFNAFHHFTDEEQLDIVRRLTDKDSPFLFCEILQPTIITFLQISITTTIGQLLIAPFIMPFSFWRLICTYLIPIQLVTTTYDGLVSVINSKTVEQFQQLFKDIPVQCCKKKSIFGTPIIYITNIES